MKAVDQVPELLLSELEIGFQLRPGGVTVFVHPFPPNPTPTLMQCLCSSPGTRTRPRMAEGMLVPV